MNRRLFLLLLLLIPLASGCRSTEDSDQIVSMQVIDRNGFTETISSKDRLTPYQRVNYLTSQPFQKVLRVFGKDEEGKSHSKLTSYHSNGGIWQYLEALDGRANGRYLEWHENGKIKIEANVIEGLADLGEQAQQSWLFDQKCTVWDSKGNLEAEFFYDKGYLTQTATHYHPNGQLKKTISYGRGVADGALKIYDEEGNLIEEIFYKDGKKQGAARGFWNPGTSKYQEQYRNGMLINGAYFDQEGELVSEIVEGEGRKAQFKHGSLSLLIDFREGRPEGQVQSFSPLGTLEKSYTTKAGQKTGEEWIYYPSKGEEPNPKLMVTWSEDKVQGMCKTWYQNGTLESQKEMSASKKHGLSFAYYETGELMLMEEYEMDKLKSGSYYRKGEPEPVSTVKDGTGTATLYTSKGLFQKKVSYDKSDVVLE